MESIAIPFYRELGEAFGNSENRIPKSLKTVILTNGQRIPKSLFDGCTYLENISIPNTVVEIERASFEDCANLKKVTLPFVGGSATSDNNPHFGYVFGVYNYDYHYKDIPKSLESVIINGTRCPRITQILYQVFELCVPKCAIVCTILAYLKEFLLWLV